jgi:hypothetical protein
MDAPVIFNLEARRAEGDGMDGCPGAGRASSRKRATVPNQSQESGDDIWLEKPRIQQW